MVSLSCGEGTPFKAAAECHPAMIDPKDAENITIPIAILASKDEDAQAVNQFKENLKVQKHVETYSNQSHGWMAARSVFSSLSKMGNDLPRLMVLSVPILMTRRTNPHMSAVTRL